jgi:hypothetical protein
VRPGAILAPGQLQEDVLQRGARHPERGQRVVAGQPGQDVRGITGRDGQRHAIVGDALEQDFGVVHQGAGDGQALGLPSMISSVVVLPAPFGPRIPKSSPVHLEGHAVHGEHLAVGLAQVTNRDRGRHATITGQHG